MKTILIRANNSRGNEQRISTFDDSMQLDVFFKGENGEVRREILYLKRTDAGSLRVENSNQLLLQTEGDVSQKLSV